MSKAAFAAFCLSQLTFTYMVLAASPFTHGHLSIQTKDEAVEIGVEIADTDAKRSQGLMFRQTLGDREGMIFLFDRNEEISMWMKNTYISLDMIFIDRTWHVMKIASQTEPLSTDVISSEQAASRVLEIEGGKAEKLGIKVGDQVMLKK